MNNSTAALTEGDELTEKYLTYFDCLLKLGRIVFGPGVKRLPCGEEILNPMLNIDVSEK